MDEFVLITDNPNSLEELEASKNEFDNQTHFYRMRSDEKSIELYGKDNITRYNELKDKFMDNISPDWKSTDFQEAGFIVDTSLNKPDNIFDNWEEKINQCKTEEINNGYIMVYSDFDKSKVYENLALLNIRYNDFMSQSPHFRDLSDGMAISIFGINNQVLYYKIKAKLLEDADNDILKDDDLDETDVRDTLNLEEVDFRRVLKEESTLDTSIIKIFDRVADIASILREDSSLNTHYKYEPILIQLATPTDYSDLIPAQVPILSPEDMKSIGVYSDDDNFYYGRNPELSDFYIDYLKDGFMDGREYLESLKSLFEKLNNATSEIDKNSIKQDILEIGWNPEIPLSKKAFNKAREYQIKRFNEKYNNIEIVDISKYDSITESTMNNDLYPIFIVCTYTYTDFGKLVRKFTHSKYSHSSMGFDSGLQTLYSFNMNTTKRGGGLSFESLNDYISVSDEAEIFVGMVLVSKEKYLKLRSNVNWYIANYDKCDYSIANLFRIVINKTNVKKYQKSMVCSQFVDNLFKLINIDLSGKTSNLTTPNDLSNTKNEKVFIVYEGLAKNYDKKKVDRLIKSLQNKYKKGLLGDSVVESTINIQKSLSANTLEELEENSLYYKHMQITPLFEKTIPVNFNDNGDLIINTPADFEKEYQKSHALLLEYDKLDNIEPMKYELSKLWFMNNVIEQKLSKPNCKDKSSLTKLRARILNDFKKYIKVILSQQKDFNFDEYYKGTDFSDSNIKITKTTMNKSYEILNNILKSVKRI